MANPSGLLLGGVLMLVHIGQGDVATLVHNAWLRTIEDGIHTYDIFDPHVSKEKVGTKEFAQATVARVGQKPEKLKSVTYPVESAKPPSIGSTASSTQLKTLVGVDVFIDLADGKADDIATRLGGGDLRLVAIMNRGTKVWPEGLPETFCTDQWRLRFKAPGANGSVTHSEIASLLGWIARAGFDPIKTENLYAFDGAPGYSVVQGE